MWALLTRPGVMKDRSGVSPWASVLGLISSGPFVTVENFRRETLGCRCMLVVKVSYRSDCNDQQKT